MNQTPKLNPNLSLNDQVRQTGEALAVADAVWTKERTPDALTALLDRGIEHADALFRAGESGLADAYATAVTLMAAPAADDACRANAAQMLALATIALAALERIGASLPADDFTAQHIRPITRYLASMLYAYYMDTVNDPATASQWHLRAQPMLTDLAQAGAVETPKIDVNGQPADPWQPMQLVADIAARSNALGFWACGD